MVKMRSIDRIVRLGLIALWIALSMGPGSARAQTPSLTAQEPDAALDALVEETLASMSVADRVGQLFLITFDGNDVGFESDIAELIHGYRIGGVVLDPANRNFSNEMGNETVQQAAALVNRLQGLAYGLLAPEEDALQLDSTQLAAEPDALLEELTGVAPVNLPLFVGLQQLGDNLPETALRLGFTPLPSQMAIGATWNPNLARDVGAIVGTELEAVGVNLLLGPNLDVLDQPQASPVGRLGVHMFGGDSQWVGRMGQAYISGVHQGSQGRVATIAGHFPGAGDIDRLPDEEVSTVQRPLEELEQIALPPFHAVTGGDEPNNDHGGITDGLMSSQARYSAFQGSSLGRNTPIGLAPELEMVLEEQGFSEWRENGGILVSGELGAPAIRRHYATSTAEFPFRRIALDAFTAGHDLLYLGRFSNEESWESQRLNIKETIGFFQERYVDDPDLAQDVDDRVRRILRLKFDLYDAGEGAGATAVPLNAVLVDEAGVTAMAEAQDEALAVVAQTAREAISILYPNPREAADVLSRVPQAGEKILIISDSRLDRECADCMADPSVAPDEIRNIILRFFGPGATDQLTGDDITTRTFADLEGLLAAEAELVEAVPAGPAIPIPTVTPAPLPSPETEETEADETAAANVAPAPVMDGEPEDGLDANEKMALYIDEADWVIFAMLDVDEEEEPQSAAVKRFLRQHSDDLASKYVAVLALNAPYFLDATEISKLNAYYGVYSKTQPFLEDAVRALFRSYTPDGAPPVSVGGTRFSSLSERLSPDPGRFLALSASKSDGTILVDTASSDATPPTVDAGDPVLVQAGPVMDRNGNVVRDGQPVELVLTFDGDTTTQRVEQVSTRSGIAVKELQLDRGGLLEVAARAGEATSSEPLAMNVPPALDAGTTGVLASAPEAAAPPVETAAEVAMAEPAPVPVEVDPVVDLPTQDPIGPASLMIMLLTIMVMVSMLVILQVRIMPKRTLVHSILWAINCGLLAYIVYVFGWIPGTEWLQASLRVWGAALVVVVAMLAPLLWLQLRPEQ